MNPPRYVRREARVYDHSLCLLCGTAGGGGCGSPACPVAVCLACASPQCMANGSRAGTCGICLLGILPGFSGHPTRCGYRGCPGAPVAYGQRVGAVCAQCLPRARAQGGVSLAAYVASRVAERDKHWIMRS